MAGIASVNGGLKEQELAAVVAGAGRNVFEGARVKDWTLQSRSAMRFVMT